MAVRLVSRKCTTASPTASAAAPAQVTAQPSAQGKIASLDGCAELVVQNGELCLELPFVGDICVDIPDFIPDGTVAKACVKASFPACVKLTVTALGQEVVNQQFGIC